MDQSILDNLKIGEKAVDIQEYFYGQNGRYLVYKVIVYECVKKYLIFKSIETFVFPFYFKTKELAEDFIRSFDKFEIIKYNFSTIYNSNEYVYTLYPKEFDTPKNIYYMVDCERTFGLSEDRSYCLIDEKVWDGTVNYGELTHYGELYRNKNMHYSKIVEKEKLASKEGSTGKTFSYILSEV